MKKIYTLTAVASLLLAAATPSNAQCGGNRYHDYVFPATPTPTSGIVYGSNIKAGGTAQTLLLDVYQPVGDTATSRPLVIIAHGGSFTSGSKTGPDVLPLCKDLARMGYVTASIEYRLGMTNFPFQAQHQVDSTDAGAAVMRGVHDGRAAVRFFRKNARVGGNTYKIDTNNIFFAGVSAGGFIALHVAYMDQWNEFPTYIDTTGVTVGLTTGQPGMHGGIEGNSGNPGYPSNVKAVINLCGALADTNSIQAGDIPVLSFHGTVDATVPYGYSQIMLLGIYPLLKIHGSSTVAMRATHLGIPNCMETWIGQDHVPEVSNPLYYDSTITISRTFLEHFTCNTAWDCSYTTPPVVGINELNANAGFSVFPNPANTAVTVDLHLFGGKEVSIEIYDRLGRNVKRVSNIKANQYTINRDNLADGIYFINVVSEGKAFSGKVMFE